MGSNFFRGLVSGTVAAVCWISFCLMFGWDDLRAVGLWAVILLVAVTLLATVVNAAFAKKRPIHEVG